MALSTLTVGVRFFLGGIDDVAITDSMGYNIIESDGYLYKINSAEQEEKRVGVVWHINEEINRKQYVLDDGNYLVELSGYDASNSLIGALVLKVDGGNTVERIEYNDFNNDNCVTLDLSFNSTAIISE